MFFCFFVFVQYASGWFLGAILRILRLHVSLRFLSLCPNKAAAAELINYTHELLARCKNGFLSRQQKPQVVKEDQLVERGFLAFYYIEALLT